jgi:DNA-binding HxlR family transcriptional regulator
MIAGVRARTRTSARRTYGDGCSSAHALDLVGERWALLIVRDLLFGPKRFSDLQAGLPQGSPNVLTQRLRELEEAGIVRRRHLPPPASANVYELTEWGAQLEPVLMGLQRWGAASPSFDPLQPVGCDSAMLALKNGFDRAAASQVHVVAEVRFERATFALRIDAGSIDIGRGSIDHPDLVLETDPGTLEELAFAGLTVDRAEREGRLDLTGDAALAGRLLSVFSAPGPA